MIDFTLALVMFCCGFVLGFEAKKDEKLNDKDHCGNDNRNNNVPPS